MRDAQRNFCLLELLDILHLMPFHWSNLQVTFLTKKCVYFQCVRDFSHEGGDSMFLRNVGI
jgi:hypothetical protein